MKGPMKELMWWVADAFFISNLEYCSDCAGLGASILCYKAGARECHASLAHFSDANRIRWRLITAACFQLYVEILLASVEREKLSMPQWLPIIADSQPNPICSHWRYLSCCYSDVLFGFLSSIFNWISVSAGHICSPAACFQSLSTPVVADKYLIPFKIPLIMHLLSQLLSKPQAEQTIETSWIISALVNENRAGRDDCCFSSCSWPFSSFPMTFVWIPLWPLCDLASFQTWDL